MVEGWVRKSILIGAGIAALMGAAVPLLRTGPLSGRTVVLDPGHGGPHDRGAVADNGLRESDLNLLVAQRLGELLRRQGARVVLTRTTDAAVPAPADDDGGLKARASLANEVQADLFVSIHHNDTTDADDPRNDTQVYWKLDDEGPSQDFGQILLPTLAKAVHLPKQRLIPGNFAVLRHCRRPAVLGEGAYLSNPHSAAYLATPEAQQAEAQAYADSIQRYFARGVPILGTPRHTPDGIRIPVVTTDSPIAQASLTVDDVAVPARYDPEAGELVWAPTKPLTNGAHQIRALVRNRLGNASLPLETDFVVQRPAASVSLNAIPPVWNTALSSHVLLSTVARDASGYPVADGTPVHFTIGRREVEAKTLAGRASAFVPWPGETPAPATVSVGEIQVERSFDEGRVSPHVIVAVTADGADRPAAAVSLDGKPAGTVDGDGRLAVAAPPGPHRIVVKAPGYAPWQQDVSTRSQAVATLQVQLAPQYGGTLIGRRILLDPLPVAAHRDLDRRTLKVARLLHDQLAAAGAKATVTRSAGTSAAPEERVRLAERAEADLYLVIGVGDGYAAHYYASRNGARLADLVHRQLKGIAPKPDASYLLSHTPCPALVVRSPLQAPDQLAEALFQALRQYYATGLQAASHAKLATM